MKGFKIVIVGLVLSLLTFSSNAQVDDMRLWTGLTIKHKFTRKITAAITQQLRLDHDFSQIDQLLSDVGVEYELKKNLKVAFNYRFINKNKFTYYSKSHRMYVDVSYKHKISKLSFTLRERIQEEFTSVHSSETGKIPEWMLRSKLTTALDLDKRYKPYLAAEMIYLLDNAKEKGEGVNALRYIAGVEYEFNRIHALDFALIYQKNMSDLSNCLITSIGYTYSF